MAGQLSCISLASVLRIGIWTSSGAEELSPYCRVVKLSLSDLDGQSTFGMQDSDDTNETFVNLEIKKASEEILAVSQRSAGTIDLLHVNCEGCEWEMLEDIIESGHHKNIRQVSTSASFYENVFKSRK